MSSLTVDTEWPVASSPTAEGEESVLIPSYKDIQKMYDQRFHEEKMKWTRTLRERLQELLKQFASGRQTLIDLKVTRHSRHLEQWFRELFSDPSFAATVGEVQVSGSSGNMKSRPLYITLPETIGATS